jgi:alanyl-tRNA synthetase
MSELSDKLQLDYFKEQGFKRKQCVECGDYFWTRDSDRVCCGEPPCGEYTFIDNPGLDQEYTIGEMREAFLSFFEKNDHGRVEPYPVAANRWRDDVLLTQASIYNFQPLVTSGKTPPPENPLAISQPCIRMNDIDNVGKTGRHTMGFEMMAHHAFNVREDVENPEQYAYGGEVYWKDDTVRYCDELIEEMGGNLDEVVYIEDPWVGGGNAGPALEVIYRGLELATLVFMSMEQSEGGEYTLKDGNDYTEMDTYVVDTGYGLERWTWMSQGTPTVYEAIYPDMIDFLKNSAGFEHTDREKDLIRRASERAGFLDVDEEGSLSSARQAVADELGVDVDELISLMEPVESVYAIAEHCRTLAYMLGDEIVPSNTGTGYLARMVLRRTKRLINDVGVEEPLRDLVDMQAERLGYKNRDTIRDIVQTEVDKYESTIDRGRRQVRQLAEEYSTQGGEISADELTDLYDTHGIHPDIVRETVQDYDISVEYPDDFWRLVANRQEDETDGSGELAEKELHGTTALDIAENLVADVPDTTRLYYEQQDQMEFSATVERVLEEGEQSFVVLDKTAFYPEGGGQPADTGSLKQGNKAVEVIDVQVSNGVVVHETDAPLLEGEQVEGQVDEKHRRQLMRSHTATHILAHAAREVLGSHVRQAGVQKSTSECRLDIKHYDRITQEDIERIEMRANELVCENLPVTADWPNRNEAEAEHGFDIYQGGVPAGEQIRLISIDDKDIQACGGTHVSRTGEVGMITIQRTERIQDGVYRLRFVAGLACVEAVQDTRRTLTEAADVLDVEPEDVPKTSAQFFDEWNERGKQIDDLKSQLAKARAQSTSADRTFEMEGTTVLVERIDSDIDGLRQIAKEYASNGKAAILGSKQDKVLFVVAVPPESDIHAGNVVEQLSKEVGGGGGGPAELAQGGGPDLDRLDEVLENADSYVND